MATKLKITADAVLSIIKAIFADEDVNVAISDPNASGWYGKTIEEILNVEYYAYKHRIKPTSEIVKEKLKETGKADELAALNRSFCLLYLDGIERLYSKDVDMSSLSVKLEYYIQTSKIKLLEYLVEECNIELSGVRIPVTIGGQTRRAVVVFGHISISGDIQTSSGLGEMAYVDVDVDIMLYPDSVSYSEYAVKMTFMDDAGQIIGEDSEPIPLASFSAANTMTQDAVPLINKPRKVGQINLSCANSFVLVFEGYNHPFINFLVRKSLTSRQGDSISTDNNQLFTMTIIRDGESYVHEVVIKDHQMVVNADTSNETHTLGLTTRGM